MKFLFTMFFAWSCVADPLSVFDPARCVNYSLNNSSAFPNVYCRVGEYAWYLKNTGQDSICLQDGLIVPSLTEPGGFADLNLPAVLPNPKNIIIGVVDSGIDGNHPDLQGVVIGGYHVDDRNSIYGEFDYGDYDVNKHGTGVASIIAAKNDGLGMVGVAPGVKLLSVQTRFATSEIAKGIVWCVDKGVDIISLSWGESETPDSDLYVAMLYASANSVLVVSAIGNGGRNLDTHPLYPYSWALPNYVGVAGINRNGLIWTGSSYGTNAVAAPARAIVMAGKTNGYVYDSGTSFASPMVSGLAALVLAQGDSLSLQIQPVTDGVELSWSGTYAEIYSATNLALAFGLLLTVTATNRMTLPLDATSRFFTARTRPSAVSVAERIKASAALHPVAGTAGYVDAVRILQ